MAITNAQQYQQLVNKPADGKRPGYRGDAAARSTGAKQSGRADPGAMSDPGEGRDSRGRSAPTEGMGASEGPSGRDDRVDSNVIKEQKEKYEEQFFDRGQVPPLGSRPTSFRAKLDQRNKQKRLNYINRLIANRKNKILKGLELAGIEGVTEENFDELYNKGMLNIPSVADLVEQGFYSKDGRFATEGAIPDFPSMRPPGVLGLLTKPLEGPLTTDRIDQLLQENIDLQNLKTTAGLEGTNFNELMETYEPNRFKLMNPEPGGRDDDPILPILPTDDDDQTTPEDPKQILSTRILGSQFDPTFFAADGGIANLARQELFLGGIVKGVKKGLKGITRGIKKVAKSPLGKIALAAAAGGYGFGLGPFKGLAGSGFLKGAGMKNFFLKDAAKGFGLSNLSGKGIASIIGGASLLPLLMGQKEDEFDIEEYYRQNALNLNAPLNTRIAGSQFSFADGGSTEKEPVAKKTMPLLDMGGQEMDLRAEGGFVPIGRMEKADDVPARLSKNEFVFTAEAVRNAGDGDVDKGAEVMYNMMKNLEDGGDVSEESQGLEGARNMFQTSQRLGEVL